MPEWVIRYWTELLFSGFVATAGIALRYIWSQIRKNYIDQVKKNENEIKTTNDKLEQFQTDIDAKFDKLSEKLDNMQKQSKSSDLAIIRDAILRQVRHGLQSPHGCISMSEAETTAALMAQYEELGGNGEVHKLYKRYEKLNICHDYDYHYFDEDESTDEENIKR